MSTTRRSDKGHICFTGRGKYRKEGPRQRIPLEHQPDHRTELEIQEQEKPGRSAFLLDDPAAELDPQNLGRLMRVVQRVPAQLWVTSLRGDLEGLPDPLRVFHVEHGAVRPVR